MLKFKALSADGNGGMFSFERSKTREEGGKPVRDVELPRRYSDRRVPEGVDSGLQLP